MFLGLEWSAWVLVIASIGLGLGVELRFFLKNRLRSTKPNLDRQEKAGQG